MQLTCRHCLAHMVRKYVSQSTKLNMNKRSSVGHTSTRMHVHMDKPS